MLFPMHIHANRRSHVANKTINTNTLSSDTKDGTNDKQQRRRRQKKEPKTFEFVFDFFLQKLFHYV